MVNIFFNSHDPKIENRNIFKSDIATCQKLGVRLWPAGCRVWKQEDLAGSLKSVGNGALDPT